MKGFERECIYYRSLAEHISEVAVVGVGGIQYQSGTSYVDISGTLYILKGTSVTFKALPTPANRQFSSGKPVWSGTSGASGTGQTTSVTFNTVSSSTSDFKTVIATAGNSMTVNVIVYELTGTFTPEIVFSGRSYTRFGIEENITLGFTASPSLTASQIGGLRWAITTSGTGNGTLTPQDNGTAIYNAPDTYSLSQKYALTALSKADTFSLELEIKILPFVAMDLAPRTKTDDVDSAWLKERAVKARLWLHAWQRLEREIDRNFNFDDRASLNVSPPEITVFPDGVTPEAIKDPTLRAQYQAAISANAEKAKKYDRQYMLRHLDKTFPAKAEQYIVRVYSQSPFNTEELKSYLNSYISDQNRRESILQQVAKNISTGQTVP